MAINLQVIEGPVYPGESFLSLPEGSEVLGLISIDSSRVNALVLCDPNKPLVSRRFVTLSSYQSIKIAEGEGLKYVGTFFYYDSAYHLFEVTNGKG